MAKLLTPAAAGALIALLGCTRAPAPPSPDQPPPPAPVLRGRTVMLLPAQSGPALRGGVMSAAVLAEVDAELAFALQERLPRVHWVLPPAMERALARAPSLNIPIHALAVSGFWTARLTRIGDPLYGDLRRLGALLDARYALVPVSVRLIPGDSGARRMEVATGLIDTVGGAVLWYGVVAGESGPADSPALRASAADALARALSGARETS